MDDRPPVLTDTLHACKAWLRTHWEKGARCPCCNQFTRKYNRQINRGMVNALARMLQAGGGTAPSIPVHLPSVVSRTSTDFSAVASHFGLIEEEKLFREDGGRAGWWRVTVKGEHFLNGSLTIPRYVHLYNCECLGFSGRQWSVHDAYKETFNLRELMNTVSISLVPWLMLGLAATRQRS